MKRLFLGLVIVLVMCFSAIALLAKLDADESE